MATVKFNNMILAVARRLKAPRTLATDDAGAYKSVLLTEYVNRSIKDLLIENFLKYGDKAFRELFPEYVKTSGALTLIAGVVAKPSDCFIVTDLKTSGTLIEFTKLRQDQVEDVRSGRDKLIIPSATHPVFWEEAGNIYTLGITTGDVIARYIVTYQDLAPITTVTTNGKWYTGANGAWTAATRTLAGTMNTSFVAGDVNKRILFRTATVVYGGRIENFISTTSVTVTGDALPLTDIAANSVLSIIVSDVEVDSNDLKLNDYWDAEIINKAVNYGLQDSKNDVVA